MGFDEAAVAHVIGSFHGVEHRLEIVRTLNGVDFYNDSTATNPSASLEGLKTMQSVHKKMVVIIGGNDKNMDFTQLVAFINEYSLACVVLIGSADEKLRGIRPGLVLGTFDNFEKAVHTAYAAAKPDGLVLLSPGATSFNMFRDEFDRRRQFKEIVHSLQ
jgi:UDP-N-acetylmuramoylalanine--D-glutamate ligase